MKNFLYRHRGLISLSAGLLLTYGTLLALGISCPIKFLTGISCPGCGMTRASLSALTLRFDMAFYFHPLWFLLLPSLALLIILRLKRKALAFNISLALMAAMLIVTYAVRLAIGSEIVVFEPQDSAVMRLIRSLFGGG